MSCRNKLAFLSGKGAVVYQKRHFDCRLAYFYKRKRLRRIHVADRLPDRYVLYARKAYYIAYIGFFYGDSLQALYLIHIYKLAFIRRLYVVIVCYNYVAAYDRA